MGICSGVVATMIVVIIAIKTANNLGAFSIFKNAKSFIHGCYKQWLGFLHRFADEDFFILQNGYHGVTNNASRY